MVTSKTNVRDYPVHEPLEGCKPLLAVNAYPSLISVRVFKDPYMRKDKGTPNNEREIEKARLRTVY